MNVYEKLQSVEGRERYEVYVELLHRASKFHEEYGEYEPVDWQYDDWIFLDETTEGCLVRSTGGSKTFDSILWLILRVLMHPKEKWAWVASASGQLTQAQLYFGDNPFVLKKMGASGKEKIILLNGSFIYLRSATVGITGLRLDGIMLDEEEMLQFNQVEMVYPQLHGRLTKSKVGKFFHLGTMQYATLFMDNLKQYSTRVRPWDTCPWLVKAGKIQKYIDEGIMPKFEINMLYRCIPSVPGGAFFENLKIVPDRPYDSNLVDYGMDFGATDHCVGKIVDGDVCTIVEEYEKDIEGNNKVYDFLDGANVEAEGGGYNDDPRYSAKALMMTRRIGAIRVAATNKWKRDRKMRARGYKVIEIFESLFNIIKDMEGCRFGPDGLWLKNRETPCHGVDAFMHSLSEGDTPKAYEIGEQQVETDRFRLLLNMRKKRGY